MKTFTHPDDALRVFIRERQYPLPNVLIVDVLLQAPIDGYEVISRFRKARGGENISIIVLSRVHSSMDRVLQKLAGADVSLSKPFQIQEIIALIEQFEIQTHKAQEREENP